MSNREPLEHDLKTWPEPFEAVWDSDKLHEVRKNDRDYQVGDRLVLREWNPVSAEYSGRSIQCTVTYITKGGSWGIPDDLCVMSIRVDVLSKPDGSPGF